jgi:pyruvate-ferredoxin/flavodoxin oxidoreductase
MSELLRRAQGRGVLERLDQPLAVDLPLIREIRATLAKCLENGASQAPAYPELATYTKLADLPPLYSAPSAWAAATCSPRASSPRSRTCSRGRAQEVLLPVHRLPARQASRPSRRCTSRRSRPYPHVRELAVHGSENPNLMPPDSITVRFHSVGGWGAITTGKNLAMTLFELLGYHIKANPKYGSEKKGQPTTYYLSAAPEPIRVNCEYFYVDVVLSPDPNVFQHTNALAGLKEGGVFIIQSDLESPREEVWESFPRHYQRLIEDKKIRLFYLDAFKIARDEATDVDLQLRMQGIAFQGAFFARLAGGGERRPRARKNCSQPSASSCSTSSVPRAPASSKTTCAWCAAATTNWSRSRVSAPGNRRSRQDLQPEPPLP